MPDMGSPYLHGTRRIFPGTFPLSIVYMTDDAEIVALAIAPFSRRPGYWRQRSPAG